jgi:hypothetical protein
MNNSKVSSGKNSKIFFATTKSINGYSRLTDD